MKKNLYYRSVFKRTNIFKEYFLTFFLAFSSWPRLLLEVFIRRNFGERYFSYSSALIMAFLLALAPAGSFAWTRLFYREYSDWGLLLTYGTWYGFLLAFVLMAYKRRTEIKRLPSVFDFRRFSLSTGLIHPQFFKFYGGSDGDSVRAIETRIEPGFFFLIGLTLFMFGQPLGTLLMICSICYALSYRAAYYQGDNFIMDKIDEMIANDEMVNSFVEGRDSSQTRGFNMYGRRPADPDMRRQLVTSFMEDEEVVEAF